MIVGATGTATAFLATLYIAQRNYLLSGLHIPRLTMTLTVERFAVSERYGVLAAALSAQTTGTGLCRVNSKTWRVLVVSPYVANASEPKLTQGWYRRAAHVPPKE